jgi:hypothetical protein
VDAALDVSGALVATHCSGARGRWWARIAERAGELLAAQGMVIFPLSDEDIRAGLEAIDAGLVKCRPLYPHCWQSHHTTLSVPYGDGIVTELHKLHGWLADALDQVQCQTGALFITDIAELRAYLVAALGDTA